MDRTMARAGGSLAIALFPAGAALSGCAPTSGLGDTRTEGDTLSGMEDCFHIRDIRDWSAIDEQHIHMEARGKEHYLLTMQASCRGIRYSQVIALTNTDSRICSNELGGLRYRSGGMSRVCYIDRIDAVRDKAEAESIVSTEGNGE